MYIIVNILHKGDKMMMICIVLGITTDTWYTHRSYTK